jgi:hypothetical protein
MGIGMNGKTLRDMIRQFPSHCEKTRYNLPYPKEGCRNFSVSGLDDMEEISLICLVNLGFVVGRYFSEIS